MREITTRQNILYKERINKGIFVKHEQAPTAPKLEGACFFVDFIYIFYENR